jgi:hypothetical protein
MLVCMTKDFDRLYKKGGIMRNNNGPGGFGL